MSGKRAKLIRRAVYGDLAMGPDAREYVDRVNPKKPETFVRYAGAMRELYRHAKRIWYYKKEMPNAIK